MTETVQALVTGISSSLVTGGLVVGAFILYLRSLQGDVRETRAEVNNLKNQEMAKLERRLDAHLQNDRSQEILTRINHFGQQLDGIDDKLDRVKDETAQQRSDIKSNRSFIENLDRSFQRHKETDHRK